MTEMNYKKMYELIADEAFMQKLRNMNNTEAIYKLFSENGLDASYEDFMVDIKEAEKMVSTMNIASEDGELSPEMLDLVSGGSARGKKILTAAGIVCLCFGNGGLALACFGLAALH